jgi:micrococcal nuclease
MYEYRVKIVKVVDGDTVDVDIDLGFGVWLKKQRVRLYGIDTPESRTRDLVEKRFGNMAKAYLKDRLSGGAVLGTRLDKKRQIWTDTW